MRDPGEAAIDRLFGRDYVTPEQAANTALEAGDGNAAKAVLEGAIGAAKSAAPHVRFTPGVG